MERERARWRDGEIESDVTHDDSATGWILYNPKDTLGSYALKQITYIENM